jgi:hypothetical protein
MKVEEKIKEAKKQFKKGTKFLSFDYSDWIKLNEQVDNEVIFKEYQPNFLWVKAKVPFGEIMWVPIYDASKNQWALIEENIKTKKNKTK